MNNTTNNNPGTRIHSCSVSEIFCAWGGPNSSPFASGEINGVSEGCAESAMVELNVVLSTACSCQSFLYCKRCQCEDAPKILVSNPYWLFPFGATAEPECDLGTDFSRVYTVSDRAIRYSSEMAQGGSRVKVILSDSEFQKELISSGNKLVVVDFFATWYAVLVCSNWSRAPSFHSVLFPGAALARQWRQSSHNSV